MAWFPALTGVARLAHPALPVPAALPWLAVAGLYSTFCGWSYRDLIAACPAAGGRAQAGTLWCTAGAMNGNTQGARLVLPWLRAS